ncbi:MAG: hypothetical protein AB7G93_17710 [Bdellovibrionales bacterium]
MSREQPVKIVKKKIKPYPIEAVLEANALKKTVEIMYLTAQGAVVRLGTQMVFVGEYYQTQFQIPVMRESIRSQCRIIRTFDRAVDPKNGVVERLAEFHFQNLTPEHKERIVSFTKAIGQA